MAGLLVVSNRPYNTFGDLGQVYITQFVKH